VTRGKTPDDQPPAQQSVSIESATKAAAGAAAIAYAVGLIVVNYYLLPFGASDFNLFRARFVFTGLLFLAIVAISTGAPWAALNLMTLARRGRDAAKKVVGAKRRVAVWLIRVDMILCGLLLLVIPLALFVFVLKQPLLSGVAIYFSAGVAGGIVGLMLWFVRTPHRRPQGAGLFDLGSPLRMKGVMVALLMVFLIPYLAFTLVLFARQVYPRVPEQLGGARSKPVILLLNPDDQTGLQTLGLEPDSARAPTAHVDLLFRGDDFYLVRVGRATFVLGSDVVKAVRPVDVGTGI
jgi:hypothetical protein